MFKKFAAFFSLIGTIAIVGGYFGLKGNYPSIEELTPVLETNFQALVAGSVVFLGFTLILSLMTLFESQPLEKPEIEQKSEEPADQKTQVQVEPEKIQQPGPQKGAKDAKFLENDRPIPKEVESKPPEPSTAKASEPCPTEVDEDSPKVPLRRPSEALQGEQSPTIVETEPAKAHLAPDSAPPVAYQILSLFQKEGRLLDFLMEDIAEVDDESLGGAIRPIHEGCRKILRERLVIEHIVEEPEGDELKLDKTVDVNVIKLTGNVPPNPPYKGVVVHRGWRLKECHLPELVAGWSGKVVAPAEVEIQ